MELVTGVTGLHDRTADRLRRRRQSADAGGRGPGGRGGPPGGGRGF